MLGMEECERKPSTELRRICRDNNVSGRSGMDREQMINSCCLDLNIQFRKVRWDALNDYLRENDIEFPSPSTKEDLIKRAIATERCRRRPISKLKDMCGYMQRVRVSKKKLIKECCFSKFWDMKLPRHKSDIYKLDKWQLEEISRMHDIRDSDNEFTMRKKLKSLIKPTEYLMFAPSVNEETALGILYDQKKYRYQESMEMSEIKWRAMNKGVWKQNADYYDESFLELEDAGLVKEVGDNEWELTRIGEEYVEDRWD